MMAEQPPKGIEKYLDRDVFTVDGKKLGVAARLLNNRLTSVAEWLVVEGGLLGREKYVVPLAGSELSGDGVIVGFNSSLVTSEPHGDVDGATGTLRPDSENALNAHFGLGASAS